MSTQNFEVYLSFNAHSGGFLQAFFARSRDKIMAIFEKSESGEGNDAGLAQTAAAVHPAPVKTADYLERQPYTNPTFVDDSLKGAEERGWITLEVDGFAATEKALALTDEIVRFLEDELNPLEEEVSADIPALVEQLGVMVETASKVDLPLKPALPFARNFEYEDKTPRMTWVRRHLISLGAFRDDCHMSSWQKHDLPGHVWEALTFIWQGEQNTAEKLAETLSGFRGYTVEDYTAAIDKLVELGWVEAHEDYYRVTEQGRRVREEAEDLTNMYYAKAFSAVPEAELKAISAVLEGMAAEIAPQVVEAE